MLGCGKFDLAKADNNQVVNGKRLLREWGFSDGNGAVTACDPYRSHTMAI